MYLFFDTETTGIPRNYKAPASDLANWPRLVQLGWVLTDKGGKELASAECIVKPDGFTIPSDAAKIHGITTEVAARTGIALGSALASVALQIEEAHAVIAHNIEFDEKILGAEFLRCGRPNVLASKPRACTMQGATDFCRLPGRRGFKWPTLEELHTTLFNEPVVGVHGALVDARACARCFFELKRLKVMA